LILQCAVVAASEIKGTVGMLPLKKAVLSTVSDVMRRRREETEWRWTGWG
jgi:prolyl-tRNA synthetase